MWDRLWINLDIATMMPATDVSDDPYGCIHDAAIATSGSRIAWIGARADLPAAPDALAHTVIDGHGHWMTPGLIDAHTHIIYAGDRSTEFEKRLNGVSYTEIARQGGGILSTVTNTRAASEDTLLSLAMERAQRMIRAGITTIEVKSGYGLTLEDELKQLRVARRLGEVLPVYVHTTFLGAHAFPPEYADRQDDYVSFLIDVVLPRAAAEGLVDSVDAFCENIAFSPAQVRRLFNRAMELQLPVRIHADQLSDTGGGSLAAQYRALSADHVEYVSEAGVMDMAQAGTIAMLLPGAFYFIREKHAPPVALFRRHGVAMGLATDCNPGTSPATSLTAIMNMACTLFRMTPAETLAAVTRIGARGLNLQDSTGTLATGMMADMAIWNVSGPHELSYWIGGLTPITRIFHGVPDAT
ncbi:imidazolonepropionase [Komagataeibacter sp. FXV3]|uniref:imidazolonepropionase n=1 Tax=Komagataeibacter sp. FXV3 TaxID=2608998 RepID=UPI00187B6DA1|nr:imidazolonepropionase [Komagataeibacter sp. FXV3]MBE7728406.1 imidazolonepropionase [Komagataeibacter sp. FXV3]